MKDDIFDTPEKIKLALATLEAGKQSEFWILMCKIIDGNIEYLSQQLLNGIDGDNKEASKDLEDRLRDKLKVLKEIRNTPESMISKYTSNDQEVPSFDPYQTSEQLKKARRNS